MQLTGYGLKVEVPLSYDQAVTRATEALKALKGEIPFEEVNTLGGELFPDTDA